MQWHGSHGLPNGSWISYKVWRPCKAQSSPFAIKPQILVSHSVHHLSHVLVFAKSFSSPVETSDLYRLSSEPLGQNGSARSWCCQRRIQALVHGAEGLNEVPDALLAGQITVHHLHCEEARESGRRGGSLLLLC